MEQNDPMEPMENELPIEPMENELPIEPMDQYDPMEPMERALPSEPTECTELGLGEWSRLSGGPPRVDGSSFDASALTPLRRFTKSAALTTSSANNITAVRTSPLP